jgi:hypothetical protein
VSNTCTWLETFIKERELFTELLFNFGRFWLRQLLSWTLPLQVLIFERKKNDKVNILAYIYAH